MPEEVRVFNFKNVNPIAVKADDLLDKDIQLNNAGAEKAGKAAAETYGSALMMLAIIVGISAIAGIGIGVYLVRDVSQGIASIVKPMQALGAGDLSAVIPHQGEATEIGTMANSLRSSSKH